MKFKTSLSYTFLLIFCAVQFGTSQCKTWTGLANEDELTSDHSVYRSLVKNESYEDAFESWLRVYKAAPAADGKRDFHYTDGIKIYRDKYDKSTDEAEKKEYVDNILRLYDEVIACYESRSISMKCITDDCYNKKISDLYARKGYDMYYYFRTSYSQTAIVLQSAIDKGGMNTQYTVVTPYADIAVYEFTNENIDKAEARRIHDELLKLCTENEGGDGTYAPYYKQAKDAMLGKFREIEDYIFDCAYFQDKWMPEYEENKEDPQYARGLYNQLRQKGCEDGDPFMDKLSAQWEAYATVENARRQAEFEANNPGLLAKKAYDAGDFIGAIEKYRNAIDTEEDLERKAGYHFSIASILFRKMDKYNDARAEARKAASVRNGWGRPYELIGDIYAKSARNCGDSWNQRLAVLAAYDKWSYAKSLETDEDNASNLSSKMSRYRSSFPTKDEGFMRGMKPGSTVSVGCWIGEKVKIRYQ